MKPRTLGHYELLRSLGQGGMGTVYLAEDLRLRRRVALKLIRNADAHSADARRRFEREARAAAALDHPHICRVHDLVEDGRELALVLEYVEGVTLAKRLADGPLGVAETTRIATQIAAALAHAHAAGLVHRDVKPDNIILTADGDAKLTDFGIAKEVVADVGEATTHLTAAGTVVGTPRYMSPEQAGAGAVGPPSDVFSLAVVIYECLTGALPFRGDSPDDYRASLVSGRHIPLTRQGPARLRHVVARSLDPDAARRPTAAQLATALDPRQVQRRRRIRIGVAAALVSAAAATWILGNLDRFASRPLPTVVAQEGLVTGPSIDHDPAFSPDGGRVAYVADEAAGSSIVIIDTASRTERRIVTGLERAANPVWSDDGRQLAFITAGDDGAHVQIVDADGTPMRRPVYVQRRRENLSLVRWIEGTVYLLASGTLMGLDERAGEIRLVTHPDAGGEYLSADLSRDATRLVAAVERSGVTDLWSFDRDGRGGRRLTDDRARELNPRWAGRERVYFRSSVSGQVDLHVLDIPSGVAAPLTVGPAEETSFDVAVDGRLVVALQEDRVDLRLLAVEDGASARVTFDQRAEFDPTLGADGSLLFHRRRARYSAGQLGHAADLVLRTSVAAAEEVVLASDAHGARLSPDGARVAFLASGPFPPLLRLAVRSTASPGVAVELTDRSLGVDLSPFPLATATRSFDWAPDGRAIAFVVGSDDRRTLIFESTDLDDPVPTQIVAPPRPASRLGQPRYAPDGTLAWLVTDGETRRSDVGLRDPDGSTGVLGTALAGAVELIGWADDRRLLVAAAVDANTPGRSRLALIDRNGDVRTLAAVDSLVPGGIALDRTRAAVYFVEARAGSQTLARLSLATGARRDIASFPPGMSVTSPIELPSQELLYSAHERVNDLWIYQLGGTGRR